MESENSTTPNWLSYNLSKFIQNFSIETLLVILILVAAFASRFIMLDTRVMSHDETNHVVPSYDLFQGRGYRHDPVTHGPMQFHLVALSFFVLGDSDFSARVPAALFSVAAVAAVLFLFRRYIGRTGALIGGLLFVISPYMMFYGRYVRNEGFIELFGVLLLFSILRYLEKGDHFSLYLLAGVTVLHFCTKETAYIYTAETLTFLGLIFLQRMLQIRWPDPKNKRRFLLIMLLCGVFIALGMGVLVATTPHVAETAAAASTAATAAAPSSPWHPLSLVFLGAGILAALGAMVLLVRSIGWKRIRAERSFDMLILVLSLVLPLLTAFPEKLIGLNPLDYSGTGLIQSGIFLVVFLLISAAIGVWWNSRLWVKIAILWYAIFIVLYTTFFTNGQGFFTGMVGSLGYWLEQQGVQRGSQPWYFYALIQIPIYEYLAALGTILAVFFGFRYRLFENLPGIAPAKQRDIEVNQTDEASLDEDEAAPKRLPVLLLLVFWSVISLVAFSVAGEKMPWLTVHITLPMLLAAGWGLGFLVDIIPWKKILNLRGLIAIVLLPVFIASVGAFFGALFGNQPPFQGNSLDQLEATSSFLLAIIGTVGSALGILRSLREWKLVQTLQLFLVVFFAFMAVLTARAAYMASFINYDDATEYLVYAHSASGPKEILAQIEEISRRTTMGKNIVVAYDGDANYPFWWYLRDYPNKRWINDKPTRDLQDVPVIVAGEMTMSKMDAITKDKFISFNYMRLWWPNQDYFNLDWNRFWYAISNKDMRTAIFDIWLNRDYSLYAKITNSQTMTLENWQPSSRERLYIRKDIAAQIWNYGVAPSAVTTTSTDPYQAGMIQVKADQVIGNTGSNPGQFNAPRGIATAPDGSLYVADSRNNRIQHFSSAGDLIQTWGNFADVAAGTAPGGTFNEPWDVKIGPDGSVFVADTWNHRIQKFTADGKFIKMWGYLGQAEKPEAFWGPRGLAIDAKGDVFVTDTGNKRVVVFNSNGDYITQFGSAGIDPGQFDEPVGIVVAPDGKVYVADTWNLRIQVFSPDLTGTQYTYSSSFDISAWAGQSLDNKPFLALDKNGNLYVTDPDGYRVLEFSPDGKFIRGWGEYSGDIDGFGLTSALAFDSQGRVWVSDPGNNHILLFTLPAK